MTLTPSDIQEARARIEAHITRTPLLRMHALDERLGCKVYVKAECMQTTGAFKLRGALNKALSLSKDELQRGIVAASSGNHGKAVAYACRMLGTQATIVLPDTAAKVKEDAIRAYGAEIVHCDASERFEVASRIASERGATLVPPFNDDYVMAGQGTIGLEVMEQCPELDAVVVPVSGGGLIAGVSTAVKAASPRTAVYGAEPAVLPRYTASLAAGQLVTVQKRATVADALLSQVPGSKCFPIVAANVDAVAAVDEERIVQGMKLLLLEGKLLCEPSSAIGIGAVLQGLIHAQPTDRICFIVSGGNISLEQIQALR